MEAKTSKAHNNLSSHHHHHDRQPLTRSKTTLPAFAERVTNALLHHLQLLYRSDPNFYVLGATRNVYNVSLSTNPTCTCPDRTTPCKHILFVLIKVLGVPLDDPCLRKQTLKPSHLERLLATPNAPESLANHTLRQRFHQLFFLKKELGIRDACLKPCTEVGSGATCPICLEETGRSGERMVACEICKVPIHEECLMAWKRTRSKGLTKCVTCRSPWRSEKGDHERSYLNLSDYVIEDEKACPKFGGDKKASSDECIVSNKSD